MEVFDFMPYTYYTRMTVGGGKEPAHKRAFLLIGRPTILRFVETLQRVSKSAEVGPRRTMVSFIGMLTLVHPFATTWHFPSRGNEKFRGAFRLSADRPRMTSVRREEIEAALVMGWPLDSVILNAVKNLGAWRG